MKKSGFTLAEVLIVLVILGVIASMTVPSLLQNSNQSIYITGLGKAFATLNNAISLAGVQEGTTPGGSIQTAGDLIDNVFVPTVKISKYTKGTSTGFVTQDGMTYSFLPSKTVATCGDMPNKPEDVGGDGATEPACFIVIVDVNGMQKGPNQVSTTPVKKNLADRFVLYMYRNGVTGGDCTPGRVLRGDFTALDDKSEPTVSGESCGEETTQSGTYSLASGGDDQMATDINGTSK